MITIGQPLYGPVPNQAHIAYAGLCCRAVTMGFEITFEYVANAYIDRGRNIMCRSAIESGSTHILLIDHDMIVPFDALEKLLARDVDVVGALYFCKQPPFTPVYVELGGKDGYIMQDTYKRGFNPVGAVGAGCLLIRTEALKRVADHFGDDQWFRINQPMGEDVWFGKRCAEVGIECWLDADLECGHVGDYITTVADHLAYRGQLDQHD